MLRNRLLPRATVLTMRRLSMASALVIATAFGAVGLVRAQGIAASPPRTTLIAVADSVQLEVIDWEPRSLRAKASGGSATMRPASRVRYRRRAHRDQGIGVAGSSPW